MKKFSSHNLSKLCAKHQIMQTKSLHSTGQLIKPLVVSLNKYLLPFLDNSYMPTKLSVNIYNYHIELTSKNIMGSGEIIIICHLTTLHVVCYTTFIYALA